LATSTFKQTTADLGGRKAKPTLLFLGRHLIYNLMGEMEKSFNELGEDIYYASQADTEFVNAENEDDSLKTFEELARLVEVQQRLIVEGDLQLRKIGSLSENEEIKDTDELVDKIQKASVKIEEGTQLYMIFQQGIETSQFSLALQSAGNDDP
jgi:hypothetical protein